MRLKRLVIHGFKSFADRTEFTFESPITAIVGPNGCGKSNVVDSVRWVLGEQSAKSLRGEAMTDVIFNGSTTRKPSNMAEVTLVFDNPKDAAGKRVLNYDADEVAVTRRLFRDGTCQYEINNTQCRLKDIRELFYDTGVGVDAYSIIEQGRVDLLLQADPQERRAIFEEAAGISKFKARRREAIRKLERVDQNLLRLADIADEVDKRLRSVRIQAGRARTFQEHSQRLRELRLNYALQEYYTLQTQLDGHVAEEARLSAQVEAVAAQLAEAQMELDATRQRLEELSRNRQKMEHEAVTARAAAESARQRQDHARREIQQAQEQIRSFDADRADLQNRAAQSEQQLAAEQRQLEQLTAVLEECAAGIQQKQEEYRRTQHRLNELARELEQQKSAALENMRRAAAINNRLAAIGIERNSAVAQQQRLDERRRAIAGETQALEAACGELQQGISAAARELESLGARLEQAAGQAAVLDRRIATVGDHLAAAREHRSGLLSRQKLLSDLEARREGVSEGVKAALARRENGLSFIRGLVADFIRVDVEHAAVIEAALDGRDQMLLADAAAQVAAAADELAELPGRISIICCDSLTDADASASYDWNRHPHLVRIAADLVRCQPEHAPVVRHLLGRTAVVDTLDDALQLHRCGPPGWRYVTGSCELVEADGTIRAGALAECTGIISRRSELEALAMQIAEVDRRISDLAGELETATAEARALQQQQEALRGEMYQVSTRRVELESRLSQNGDRRAALARETAVIEREMEALAAQIDRIGAEESELLSQRSAVEAHSAALAAEGQRLSAEQQTAQEALRQCGEALTALRVRHGQVQEKQLASRQTVERLRGLCGEIARQIERVDRAAAEALARQQQAEAELHHAQQQEAAHRQRQEQLAAGIAALEQEITAADRAAADLAHRAADTSAARARLEQDLHQVQMRIGEIRVRRETLVQRTMDELQLDLPSRWQQLEQQGGYQPAETDWNAVAEEIRQLKEKIHRLGNVNLEAIAEQDELEKRASFLEVQLGDLKQSKKQLEELIDQINRDSALRFEKTLAAVRQHFQGMFRKLFGGGNADICLETELAPPAAPAGAQTQDPAAAPETMPAGLKKYDVLEAGIEIIAKPPGKQPCSISQLSGGERTMTCIALLMSIFKSRPSPFCLLDEVDAAMDEANNQRFNLLVQEFLDHSQFVIITHSKRTMQIADVLYGITMQEHGVSRKVAVRFEQVDAEGRISESAAA